jgi:hypothetical protein
MLLLQREVLQQSGLQELLQQTDRDRRIAKRPRRNNDARKRSNEREPRPDEDEEVVPFGDEIRPWTRP